MNYDSSASDPAIRAEECEAYAQLVRAIGILLERWDPAARVGGWAGQATEYWMTRRWLMGTGGYGFDDVARTLGLDTASLRRWLRAAGL